MKKTALLHITIVAFTAFLITLVLFPTIWLHPNSSMFTYGGDGIKNYFTALYYLAFNEGVHFNGMNYPFGEHLSFADAQPGLMVPLKWLTEVIPAISSYGIAIINCAVLLGMIGGAVATFLLLRRLQVQVVFAFAGALLITFLSPQMFRADSHFALSYSFFFPTAWWLFLQAEERNRPAWWISGMLFIIFIGLLHFYLAACVCLFLLAYAFFATIIRRKTDRLSLHLGRWLMPVTGMVLLQIFLRVTDHVTDRPVRPWGFFSSLAHPKTVFLPHATDLFGISLPETTGFNEGFAYIGLATILSLLLFGSALLWYRAKAIAMPVQLHQREWLFLLSAICNLLFSMGVPFVWNMEWLADKLGFIRQFRGVGRFAWCFYYTATVLTIAGLARWWQHCRSGNSIIARVCISMLLLLWTAETGVRLWNLHKVDQTAAANFLQFHGSNYRHLLEQQGVFLSRYQALLVLPHHHVGSEKFSEDKWPTPYLSIKASYETGLPSFTVMLSRTSLSQSKASMQFTGDSLLPKQMLSHLPSAKPLLVLVYGAALSPAEQRLISKARLLTGDGYASFYELPLNAFASAHQLLLQQWQEERHLYHQQGIAWCSDSSFPVVTKYFTTNKPLETAAFQDQSKLAQPLVLDTTLLSNRRGDTLTISLWCTIEPQKDALPILVVEEWYRKQRISFFELPFKWSHEVWGNRVRVSGDVVLQQPGSRLKLYLHQGAVFGNLLIRKKHQQVVIPVETGGIYFNNLPVGQQ